MLPTKRKTSKQEEGLINKIIFCLLLKHSVKWAEDQILLKPPYKRSKQNSVIIFNKHNCYLCQK